MSRTIPWVSTMSSFWVELLTELERYLTDEAMECYIRSLLHKVSSLYTFNVTEKVEVLMRKYGVRMETT